MAEEGNRAVDLVKDTSISYLVQLALEKLLSCLQNGVGSLLGDGDELEKIKCSLNTIQSVIGSAEERPLKDQALVDWLEKLKDAAYDAEDILDEYATEDLRRQVEAQNSNSIRDPLTNKVRKIASSILNFPVVNRTKRTLKLKEIRRRLESIEEERHKFQLSERVLKWENEFKDHRQTHSFVEESQVYGRDRDRVKMVNLLLLAVPGREDENVSVIPIVGIGGLGKTTLAQLVFNDDRVQNHFELKMWICVSDDFDVRRLMGKIIERATRSTNSDVSDLEDLQCRVRDALNGRRFLLVLDDVWNEELEKWNKLRVLLMCGRKGSRIVVTTRSRMIALIMSRIEPHNLEGLSEEDCWKLFASWAFPDHREKDHPNLVAIGKDIVRKCRGVPLAVKTLGGLLSFKRRESEWVFVRDSELWNLAAEDVGGILPALRLSYYHLNPYLRQCFSFCAIFPKDHNIDKEYLIELWMAHGCVPSRRGMELEDIGNEILNELLMRSLFQEVKDDRDESLQMIKVHDLVHDLAQSVMGNDCCVIDKGESFNISKRVRHLSFDRIFLDTTPPDCIYEAQSLRTLLFIMVPTYEFMVTLDMAIFKSLRVLDTQDPLLLRLRQRLQQQRLLEIQSVGHRPLPTSLGELIHLRYLRLAYVEIETLPESISNLQNLQTFKLYGCNRLRELPRGTRNLINLRCLDIDWCPLSHMPAEIKMLSCLRKLTLFVVGDRDNTSVCSGIEELQCLNLRGNLCIEHLERIAIPSNAQQANLIGKPNLDSLQLRWCKPGDDDDYDNTLKVEAEEEVLKGLQPHENLKELEISGYRGIHFPNWMMGFLLSCIVKITLKDCRRCKLLPPLGQLPSLKILHIRGMDCVENIGSEFYGNDMSEGFPSLKKLEIDGMSSLKVWSGLHSKRVFPRLVNLEIGNCPMLTTIFTCFHYLTALQTLSIFNCDKLANLPKKLQCLTSLQFLKISGCTDLKSLPKGIGNLSSLRQLEITNVGLTSLPRGIGNLSSLRLPEFHIVGLTSLPETMQELSTLMQLQISNCPQLTFLPEWVGNLTALQSLIIQECPQMASLPVGLQRLTRLRYLRITKCPELRRRYKETCEDLGKIQHIPYIDFWD